MAGGDGAADLAAGYCQVVINSCAAIEPQLFEVPLAVVAMMVSDDCAPDTV